MPVVFLWAKRSWGLPLLIWYGCIRNHQLVPYSLYKEFYAAKYMVHSSVKKEKPDSTLDAAGNIAL